MSRLYLIGGVLTVVAALCGALWVQSGRIDALTADKASLTLQQDACTARTDNIRKDKESDDAIDNIPDSGLGHVPDGWLLPQAGSGSVY